MKLEPYCTGTYREYHSGQRTNQCVPKPGDVSIIKDSQFGCFQQSEKGKDIYLSVAGGSPYDCLSKDSIYFDSRNKRGVYFAGTFYDAYGGPFLLDISESNYPHQEPRKLKLVNPRWPCWKLGSSCSSSYKHPVDPSEVCEVRNTFTYPETISRCQLKQGIRDPLCQCWAGPNGPYHESHATTIEECHSFKNGRVGFRQDVDGSSRFIECGYPKSYFSREEDGLNGTPISEAFGTRICPSLTNCSLSKYCETHTSTNYTEKNCSDLSIQACLNISPYKTSGERKVGNCKVAYRIVE